jgi:hypothetical protein
VKPRATDALAQLPDTRLFEETARGLALTAGWIEDLEGWATRMVGDDAAGGEVIRLIADEEAAKFLILVDAIRCPRHEQKRLVAQLRRCNDHLAKGIYATVCDYSAGSFEELVSYIEPLRQSHYLDGPNDVDWIFRNEIEGRREQRLYVDYVETDDGRDWWEPNRYDELSDLPSRTSRVVDVVRSLIRAGLGSSEGLAVIAKDWRTFEPVGSSWGQLVDRIDTTLATLEEIACLGETFHSRDRAILHDSWTFPLYGADLSMVKVTLDSLRERQARWTPD